VGRRKRENLVNRNESAGRFGAVFECLALARLTALQEGVAVVGREDLMAWWVWSGLGSCVRAEPRGVGPGLFGWGAETAILMPRWRGTKTLAPWILPRGVEG